MTSLLERITGTADNPEETRVTTPRPYAPAAVPWWAGVYGLDPAIPVGDWAIAARCTAMACAVRIHGVDAPYRAGLFKSSPATRWHEWLWKAVTPVDAAARRLALRLVCDQAGTVDPDHVLQVAQDLLAAVGPPR